MVPINIDRTSGGLSRQVYEGLRELILKGRFVAGERLPASRRLAEELCVSRHTVVQAYDRLMAEGYLQARKGSGVFVAALELKPVPPKRQPAITGPKRSELSHRLETGIPRGFLARGHRHGCRFDFMYGEPSYENFPMTMWARTLSKAARGLTRRHLAYPPYAGIDVLRENLATYLGRARGIDCEADDVMIVHGTQEAIDICCRVLLDPGDSVIIEEPFYRGFVRSAAAVGARLKFVSVDGSGLLTDRLPEAKLAFLTPAHQFPSGGVLPVGRRMQVLNWARQNNALVFEDDYDGEFRYGGPPIMSMKSMDELDSVIYVGTASKTFFPSLRLGWMVLPRILREPMLRMRAISDTSPPALEQLAFAEFIGSGQFERHIFRTRKLYARKRAALLDTLKAKLGDQIEVIGSDAGIHLLIRLPGLNQSLETELVARCLARDVGVYPSTTYYETPPPHTALLLGYSAISERDIPVAASILAEEIHHLS